MFDFFLPLNVTAIMFICDCVFGDWMVCVWEIVEEGWILAKMMLVWKNDTFWAYMSTDVARGENTCKHLLMILLNQGLQMV